MTYTDTVKKNAISDPLPGDEWSPKDMDIVITVLGSDNEYVYARHQCGKLARIFWEAWRDWTEENTLKTRMEHDRLPV